MACFVCFSARLVNSNQANIISIIEMISQELGIDVDVDILAVREGGLWVL